LFLLVNLEFYFKLLRKNVSHRLGAGEHDAADVKRQSFFKNIIWEDLLLKKIKPPFVPIVVCIHFSFFFSVDDYCRIFFSELLMMFQILIQNLHRKNQY